MKLIKILATFSLFSFAFLISISPDFQEMPFILEYILRLPLVGVAMSGLIKEIK